MVQFFSSPSDISQKWNESIQNHDPPLGFMICRYRVALTPQLDFPQCNRPNNHHPQPNTTTLSLQTTQQPPIYRPLQPTTTNIFQAHKPIEKLQDPPPWVARLRENLAEKAREKGERESKCRYFDLWLREFVRGNWLRKRRQSFDQERQGEKEEQRWTIIEWERR